jgi:NCS1 family nucleobase:cation symporter-1
VDPKTLWDPVVVLAHVTSSSPPPGLDAPVLADPGTRWLVAVLSLVGVAVATVATNIAANVVSPANDFANCAPRLIGFRTGGVITGVIGILIMPWKLLASADTYIFEWLVGYGGLLGPIAGIMIADYWIVKRRELDVADLYRPRGRYAGTNPVAIVALCAGVAPNVVGFLRSVRVAGGGPDLWDAIYPYSWFTGVLVAGAVYLAGMRGSRFGRAPA